jgi:integrase
VGLHLAQVVSRLAAPWHGGQHDLVFPNDEGEMWSRNARMCEVLWKACDNCNLPRIRVHDLRHCYAAFHLMAGGNLYDLQKNLGHHSVAFTADIYGNLSEDHRTREALRVSCPAPKSNTTTAFVRRT